MFWELKSRCEFALFLLLFLMFCEIVLISFAEGQEFAYITDNKVN